jgi:hypothetical protein
LLTLPDVSRLQEFCDYKAITLFTDLMRLMQTFSQFRERSEHFEAENQVTSILRRVPS